MSSRARSTLLAIAKWVIGPLAVGLAAGTLGQARIRSQRGTFFESTAALSDAERKALEAAPASAVANATWAFGSADSVKKMLRIELDRLPESETTARARVLVRFGVFDRNPEGQAAIFAQACAADASLCDDMKEAAQREAAARLVPPGNTLPVYFVPHHPPISGGL